MKPRRRPVMVELDANAPVARALRALQRLDAAAGARLEEHRDLITEAQTLLGAQLGLVCTGHRDDRGTYAYDHSGETCKIHEWLVVEDAPTAEAVA